MGEILMPHQMAALAQRKAAHPHHSTWVAASAGSGKTKVLTDRILNLLLEGYAPERILCLTFTKAAAAEMANRLRARLGEWAILSKADLKKSIEDLQESSPSVEKMERAQRLFGLTLDAPGGLKIQTIHSFCQSLLKRFPLEAGLSPFFEVTDETESQELLKKASHAVMEDPLNQDVLKELVLRFSEFTFEDMNTFILQERDSFDSLVEEEIDQRLDTKNLTKAELLTLLLTSIPEEKLRKAIPLLEKGSLTDQERGMALAHFLSLRDEEKQQKYEDYLGFFLTQKGEKRVCLLTQKVAQMAPGLKEFLEEESYRLKSWLEKWNSLDIAIVSKAFLQYSLAFLKAYDQLKKDQSLLDYDDLILKTVELLKNPGCHWVLYKLDGGLDHILVDEAQDTSPSQWQVIRAIAEEFYANASEGAHERTLFIVGDGKQSIYSFQGADPQVFSQMQQDLRAFAKNSGKTWHDIDLNVSFRSTPEILSTVDAVFSTYPLTPNPLIHLPFRKHAPGHVEVWPLLQEQTEEALGPWQPPVVQHLLNSPQKQLAHIMAKTIQGWLLGNGPLSRPVVPGDILILVRRRTAFVDTLIRALKDHDVPVAGIDRLWLLEGIGIQDLLKIAEFLLLPEDDLTLATVLKGPLFGLSEEDLFALASARDKNSLWHRLQGNERFKDVTALLKELLSKVDFLTPFSIFSLILGSFEGRKKWHARLGPEVLDSLDEFLNLCLVFQEEQTPSLQGFLQWISQEIIELKRDLDQSNLVRVMTVHGSKGLQAPIVFLPDTTQAPRELPPFAIEGKALLWLPPTIKETPLIKMIKQGLREKQQEEYRRLLYVALTRAEDALYVCGWEGSAQDTWYHLVKEGIQKIGEEVEFDFSPYLEGKGWRLSSLKGADYSSLQIGVPPPFLIPQWLKTPPPVELPPKLIRPSEGDEGGNLKPSQYGAFGTQRGTLIHKLLEVLPNVAEDIREKTALRFLEKELIPEDYRGDMIQRVLRVFQDYPDLFSPSSQGEVTVRGMIGQGLLSGKIDRLVVNEEHVFIVDYKTHEHPPHRIEDIPPAYFKQMAMYQEALLQIYPQKPILCGLLWTELPRLDLLPDAFLKKFIPLIDEKDGWIYTQENQG
jgi:ATP-dependent helicase/nuclease subunit A